MEVLVGQTATVAAKIAVLLVMIAVTTFASNLLGIGLIINRKTNLKFMLQCAFLIASSILLILFWRIINFEGMILIILITKLIIFGVEWYLSCFHYKILWHFLKIVLLLIATLVGFIVDILPW